MHSIFNLLHFFDFLTPNSQKNSSHIEARPRHAITIKVADLGTSHLHPERTGIFASIFGFIKDFFCSKKVVPILLKSKEIETQPLTEEEKVVPVLLKSKEIETQPLTEEEKISNLMQEFNLETDSNFKNLTALASQISLSTMLILLDQYKEEVVNEHSISQSSNAPSQNPKDSLEYASTARRILFNTFLKIGKEIQKNSFLISPSYFKRTLTDDRQLHTHAFGITSESIYIAFSKQMKELVGEGTYKVVTGAIQINPFNEQSFEEQVHRNIKIKPNLEIIADHDQVAPGEILDTQNNALRDETRMIFNVLQNNQHAIEPYSFGAVSSTGKVVYFQKRYDGDGSDLIEAPLFHQLNALIGAGRGLDLFHQDGYVHMDFKPANMLFSGNLNQMEKPVEGKISDVGLSVNIGSENKGGPIGYLPPEALELQEGNLENNYCIADEKIDSFSFGMVIWDMIAPIHILDEFSPYKYNQQAFQSGLDHSFRKARNAIDSGCPESEKAQKLAMLDLSYNLLQFEPEKRLTCGEAAQELEKIQARVQ